MFDVRSIHGLCLGKSESPDIGEIGDCYASAGYSGCKWSPLVAVMCDGVPFCLLVHTD